MQPRPGVLLTPLPCREPCPRRGRTEDGRSRCGPGLLEARAQGRRLFGPRAFARREGGGLLSPGSASRKAGGHACNPPGSARCKGSGLSALGQSHDARAAAFRPPGNRAAQGRRPFGPRKSRGARAAAFRLLRSASRKAGGHARNLPGSARREGVLPTRARLPAGNAAFLGPPPGWGSRGTGAENPPGRGMGLGGFGKREGDQRESLVETSGRCSRSSRSVRPRPGASSRWMWPSRMPMSPSMISGKVR